MLKSSKLFKLCVILCVSGCLGMFNFDVFAQSGDSLVLTGSFNFSMPDGTFEFFRYESHDGDQVVINGNYISPQGLSFCFNSSSQNRTVTFTLAGGVLEMHWLESGFLQLKVNLENGRSVVVQLDKCGNPQNPNSISAFSEALNLLNPNADNGPASFINFGLNNGFLRRGLDDTIFVNDQKILEHFQTMSAFGCTIATITLVASTAIMIADCATTGPGCIIGVIMQKLAVFGWVEACLMNE